MLAVGWGLAAVLSAVAGMMAAPALFVFTPNFMQVILIYAFAAAVLGGIDSPVGAIIGGLALGVTINLLGTYVGFVDSEMQLPVALVILLAVLVLRPGGLLGSRLREARVSRRLAIATSAPSCAWWPSSRSCRSCSATSASSSSPTSASTSSLRSG